MSQKPKVAFICVHNSCRSQIAEALGKYLASDVFESYSAGTETVPKINQDAVRLMKQLYGIGTGRRRARGRRAARFPGARPCAGRASPVVRQEIGPFGQFALAGLRAPSLLRGAPVIGQHLLYQVPT